MKKTIEDIDGKRMYEGMFILKASTASKDWSRASGEVKRIIETHGGELVFFEKWDERKLIYEIRKQNKGVYVLTYFRMIPGNVDAFKKEVVLSSIILRLLVLVSTGPPQKDEPKEEPAEKTAEAPKEDKPTEEKPTEEKPAEEKATEEKATEEKATEEKPTEEKPTEEKPTEEKPTEEKPDKEPAKAAPAEEPETQEKTEPVSTPAEGG